MRRRGGHPRRPACRRNAPASSSGRARWPARRSSAACRGAPARRARPSAPCATACAPRTTSSRCCATLPSASPAPDCVSAPKSRPASRTMTAVTATLVDRASGAQEQVRAQYVIAADGAQSAVRQQLGVPMLGQENVYDSVNILLNADLRPWTADRPAALYFIEHPQMRGTFLTINGIDRWGFLVNSLAAYGYKASDFTAGTVGGARAHGGRRCRSRRQDPGRRAVDRLGARGRALSDGPHLPRRRCRARNAADRRLRHEHRRPGRAQPRLEARLRAAGRGKPAPARHLSRRTPAARPDDHPAKPEQRHLDGAARPQPPRRRAPGPNTSTNRA